ncbi:MAG: hypothetical protein BLITH_0210 [Brockia lithotrophica]|uniref:Cell division protein ZapA n=1 Tax=Brockia lithotrophica TaxID=933949 RepID=A0A2T5GAC7_9BACL|nr:MAG: hypothetical protein BLITH_0210 [Brockia lithotrophica]
MKRTATARVKIFGETYHLKGDTTEQHLHRLAEMVDQRMREIAARSPHLDVPRVAVLAALSFADEVLRLRRELDEVYELLEEETDSSRSGEKPSEGDPPGEEGT